MKNNKGITIIALIITIVAIIILAAITIYYGLGDNTDKAVETKNVYDVYEIVEAVTNRSLMNDLNSSYYKYIGKTSYAPIKLTINDEERTYTGGEGWYLINSEEEFRELGVSSMTGEYLVNYDTGSVISVHGIMYKDVVYYDLNDLKKDMGGGSTILSKVEYDANKGVNKPVLSKGMVPVKTYGTDWVVTSTDDEEWYDYSNDQKAWANVMLMDELSVEGYDNAAVREAPISELVGKKVETEGSAYVWIPRYTATSVGETGSKIIFSNLTTDTTSANGETYTCPSSFTFGEGTSEEIELTGIWVSKYEAGFSE